MIEVKNLVKRYPGKQAVDDISFTVNDGEILGFLGPNGAGKSTTMNIITGYLSATSGSVTIDGFEILNEPVKAKSKIGFLPEHPPLYPDMTVKDYLGFMFDLKKINLPKEVHIKEICETVKINDVYTRLIKRLSKGYKQRVGLAQALLGYPPLLILDEPTVGLDPKQIIEIRNLIKSFGKKHTVILSSHILSEVQATCDRIIVINEGKIIADNPVNELEKNIDKSPELVLIIEGDKDAVSKTLKAVNGILDIIEVNEKEPGTFEYCVKSRKDSDVRKAIYKELTKIDCTLLSMYNKESSLEDVFLKLTEKENNTDENTSDDLGGESNESDN